MTDENTRLPSDSVVEALRFWNEQSLAWLSTRYDHAKPGWMEVAIAKGTAALQALAAQPRDDVRKLLREALQQVKDTLVKHHQWHAAQTDEDAHGVVPADAYNESALYDQTVRVLGVTNLLLTDGMMNTDTALSQGDEQPVTWWMIERHDLEPSPQYFRSEGHAKHSWTDDWKRGTRFDTQNAACNETNGDPLLLVVEHGYLADPQTDEQPRDVVEGYGTVKLHMRNCILDMGGAELSEQGLLLDGWKITLRPQTDEQPDTHDMTEAECAIAYRELFRQANHAGFATVGEWIDEQPDTDGLAGEPRAWIFHGPENQKEVHSHHQIDVTDVPGGWSVEPLYTASDLRTDRKAVLEEAAKVAEERAEACRLAGNQGGIDPIEASILDEHLSEAAQAIRALAEGEGK